MTNFGTGWSGGMLSPRSITRKPSTSRPSPKEASSNNGKMQRLYKAMSQSSYGHGCWARIDLGIRIAWEHTRAKGKANVDRPTVAMDGARAALSN